MAKYTLKYKGEQIDKLLDKVENNIGEQAGSIKIFSNKEDREGYLLCSGGTITSSKYPALVNKLSGEYKFEDTGITIDYTFLGVKDNTEVYFYVKQDKQYTFYKTTDFIDFQECGSRTASRSYSYVSLVDNYFFFMERNATDGNSGNTDFYASSDLVSWTTIPMTTSTTTRPQWDYGNNTLLMKCSQGWSAYTNNNGVFIATTTPTGLGSPEKYNYMDIEHCEDGLWMVILRKSDDTWYAYYSTDNAATFTQCAKTVSNNSVAGEVIYNPYNKTLYQHLARELYRVSNMQDIFNGGTFIVDAGLDNSLNIEGLAFRTPVYTRNSGTKMVVQVNFELASPTSKEFTTFFEYQDKIYSLTSKKLYYTLLEHNVLRLPTMNDTTNQIYGYIKTTN